jgi:hypothetical protein
MTETNETTPAAANDPLDAAVTTINRKWSIKLLVIIGVSVFMAAFFLYDGAVRYPDRGALASEYLEFQYLKSFDQERGGIASLNGVDDPVARLHQLEEKERSTGSLDTTERAMVAWLVNLKLINRLTPDATAIPRTHFRGGERVESAAQRLEELTRVWTQKAAPTPLSAFDIPSQWAGMAVCVVIAFWVGLSWARGCAKSYRWDRAAARLTLPGGHALIPSDIAEVDKRKWDKLYVSLRIKPEHPTLGGRTVEFDLLRYEPLEAWILEMERQAFPPEPAPPQAVAAAPPA